MERPADENNRCNCQGANKANCPVPGECFRDKVVYHAAVKDRKGSTAKYVGSIESSFKLRYANHKKVSIWQPTKMRLLCLQGPQPQPWCYMKIPKKCSVYEPGASACDLCMSEKEFIIKNIHKGNLINKCTDIGNKCIHRRKRTLKHIVWRRSQQRRFNATPISAVPRQRMGLHNAHLCWTVW